MHNLSREEYNEYQRLLLAENDRLRGMVLEAQENDSIWWPLWLPRAFIRVGWGLTRALFIFGFWAVIAFAFIGFLVSVL